jgi:intein/homing endonuclease
MHKQFVSIIRETNQQKLGDLLVRIGMKERQYRDGDSIQDKLKAPIDFESFEFLRKEERTRTDEYLMQCISHGRQD